jgi:urease accessory protein
MIATVDWRLLHLADSALPTGAYAFSSGLEAAAKIGLIGTIDDLEAFIQGSVQQLYGNELAFVRSCFELDATDDDATRMLADYDATLLIPDMRRASLTLASTWRQLMGDLYGSEAMAPANELLALCRHRHFIIAYGATMRAGGYTFEQAVDLLVYGCVRDLSSAAIRLGLIGPSRGHALIHRLCQSGSVGTEAIPSWRSASRCFPVLEFAQAAHASLYSRLFQN